MSANWDRPWDRRGDDESDWGVESEGRFDGAEGAASDSDHSAAAEDAENASEAWDGEDETRAELLEQFPTVEQQRPTADDVVKS